MRANAIISKPDFRKNLTHEYGVGSRTCWVAWMRPSSLQGRIHGVVRKPTLCSCPDLEVFTDSPPQEKRPKQTLNPSRQSAKTDSPPQKNVQNRH